MSKKALATIQVGLAFLIWSLVGPILNRSSFTALQSLCASSLLACLYLLVYASITGKLHHFVALKKERWLLAFLLTAGFCGVLWFQSLTLLPIALAVLLYNMGPVFTFLLGALLLKEAVGRMRLFALFISLVGVTFLVSNNLSVSSFNSTIFFGLLTVLCAALLHAAQTVLAKKLTPHYPPWLIVWCIMLAQFIAALPFAVMHQWQLTPFSLGSILYLSTFDTILAFFLFVTGLQVLRSSTVALLGAIDPCCTALWGYLFLAQPLTGGMALGGVCILTAGYIAVRGETAI